MEICRTCELPANQVLLAGRSGELIRLYVLIVEHKCLLQKSIQLLVMLLLRGLWRCDKK